MARSYNGRFNGPEEPKKGTKWLLAGLACILLWETGIGIAVSVGCFIAYGKRAKEQKIYKCFNQYCAVIGMRDRVSFKELAKVSEMSAGEARKLLQEMVARGYFGAGAYLDVDRGELVLPPAQGYSQSRPASGWRALVTEILDALKGENVFSEPVQDAEYVRETPSPRKPEAAKAQPEAAKPQTEARPQAQQPQNAAHKPGGPDSVKKSYMDELERTLDELYQLNEQIEDAAVSQRIDRIGALTAGIFRAVIEKPEREQDVRKFMNYYLPTTIKLLKSYDMLEDQSYQGENIVASRRKIESVLDMLIEAFEKQLDRLFQNDALDIATDIDVLETMMAGDGLSGKGQMRMG